MTSFRNDLKGETSERGKTLKYLFQNSISRVVEPSQPQLLAVGKQEAMQKSSRYTINYLPEAQSKIASSLFSIGFRFLRCSSANVMAKWEIRLVSLLLIRTGGIYNSSSG
jgi:hypothetical protein